MDIKHGDIITLDNGDVVEVSLKVLKKKVTELVVGEKYYLDFNQKLSKYHLFKGFPNCSDFSEKVYNNLHTYKFIFIGSQQFASNEYYFFMETHGTIGVIFYPKNIDFVIEQIN